MTGHTCPECGGRQDAGRRPGCDCEARTAQPTGQERLTDEEQRAARSAETAAEIAAAEDFDPLRIRPYVTLSSGEEAAAGADGAPGGGDRGASDAATTMPLFLAGAEGGPLPDAAAGDDARRRTAGAYAGSGPDPVQPRRRRPFAVLAVGAAVAAVVGTAAFAGGLFGGDGADDAGREEALPEMTTSTADTGAGPAPSESRSSSTSPSPSRPASASPSASTSAPPSRSPEATRSSSASPSARTTASPSASTTPPTTTPVAPPVAGGGPTLRRGDHGDEVAELQQRLQKLWLYQGPADGDFTDRVEDGVHRFQSYMSIDSDPAGVYGPATRRALEEQTSDRDRR